MENISSEWANVGHVKAVRVALAAGDWRRFRDIRLVFLPARAETLRVRVRVRVRVRATSQTDYENTFRRPRFPMLCTLCLELVGL